MSLSKHPSVVITCCGRIDYDAMGSMVAASKLYEDAVVFLPGERIKKAKDFFADSVSPLLNFADQNQLNTEEIDCLVVVGKNPCEHFDQLENFFENREFSLHWYSHEPTSDVSSDLADCPLSISSLKTFARPHGAITTVVTEILRERNLVPSPQEATIMALGIYEGTGLFTRTTTSEADFAQAGFLLSCGADFAAIVNLVIQDGTMGFLHLSNELTDEISMHRINGQQVHIARAVAAVSVQDLSSAVHKIKQIKNLDTFFAIVHMENKMYIVGITSFPGLNIREVFSLFSTWQAVQGDCICMRDSSLSYSQVEAELIDYLGRVLQPPKNARALMASPAITISPMASCEEAAGLMTRYNINTLLVVEPENHIYEGYITRQIVGKSLFHGLGSQPVEAYMNNETTCVSPESELAEIEQKVIDGNRRVIPVISENKIKGVITRTDLYSYLFRYNHAARNQGKDGLIHKEGKRFGIEELMSQHLAPELLELLASFGRTGEEMGVGVYAVGGFVRDVVLDHSGDDLDIVVEGDAISFARYFAKKAGCQVHSHEKFNTAVIVLPNGFKVDVASARREYYTNPAALPTVEQSSIKMDLARRDFTINTLAIHLNPGDFGNMIDYFDALKDIQDKKIRVIHNLSFVEDPTRIFRAVRFAGRFGFTFGAITEKLIRNALEIGVFENLTGIRIFSEIKQILSESNPLPALEQMASFQLEKVIHRDFSLMPRVYDICQSIGDILSWHEDLYGKFSEREADSADPRQWPVWAVYFMGFLHECSEDMCREIAVRLMMSGREIRLMLETRFRAQKILRELEEDFPLPDWQVYWKVVEFCPDMVLYMMAVTASQDVRQALMRFYTCHRTEETKIRGKDLVAMNIRPGPVYSKITRQIINERIQGNITTREEELDFVAQYLKQNNVELKS